MTTCERRNKMEEAYRVLFYFTIGYLFGWFYSKIEKGNKDISKNIKNKKEDDES